MILREAYTPSIMHSDVRRDSFICVTRLIQMGGGTYFKVWHDSFICVTRLIHVKSSVVLIPRYGALHMNVEASTPSETNSWVWYDVFRCVMWLIDTCDMIYLLLHSLESSRSLYAFCVACRDRFSCVTWLICMCDKIDIYVWHVLLISMTRLNHSCSYVTLDSSRGLFSSFDAFRCVRLRWRIQMCDITVTRVYLWQDLSRWVAWLVFMCDMTHS